MICSDGEADLNKLYDAYNFIRMQFNFLMKRKTTNMYFINILDGNTSFHAMRQFNYIINKPVYDNFRKYVFVGDMLTFKNTWDITYKYI